MLVAGQDLKIVLEVPQVGAAAHPAVLRPALGLGPPVRVVAVHAAALNAEPRLRDGELELDLLAVARD